MKTQLLLILISVLISQASFGDIIMPNTHYVTKCVKITNVEDYPDVTFVGFIPPGFTGTYAYVISSSECLTKGYKMNDFKVYAISKAYLTGKDISKIDFPKIAYALPSNIAIEPYKGNVNDSIPISAIEEYYKVVGFSDSKVILYKWKQVTKYNNGKPDLIETFEYALPVVPIYQKIMVGVNTSKKQPIIELYPNPAHKNVHLRINDPYIGKVPVELHTAAGKVLKTFSLSKSELVLDYDIPVADVAKGVCFIKIQMGKTVESKKVIIK